MCDISCSETAGMNSNSKYFYDQTIVCMICVSVTFPFASEVIIVVVVLAQ